eukprot:GHVQ01019490.1.p2 GENE.GHVQ01019490.1~~GHVQ01019490.1.p2  ORF type:complete len:120 (+),score=29.99 GHVQ01019490.1:313-672(+)
MESVHIISKGSTEDSCSRTSTNSSSSCSTKTRDGRETTTSGVSTATVRREDSATSRGTHCMSQDAAVGGGGVEKVKLCCVCKETKSARDECIVMNGEDMCRSFIEAHNQCLRHKGFHVD